jgi:CheY-like chemotaxis protein
MVERQTSILLVEDDVILSVLTKIDLEYFGFEVVAVTGNGEEAIQLVNEKNPDVILMDVNLHGHMDGVEAAQRIKKTYNIPIVFLTGSDDSGTMKRCLASKPNGVIRKPCCGEDLRKAIQQALFNYSPFQVVASAALGFESSRDADVTSAA